MSETVFIVILTFSGIFTFAFGLAWFLPLVAARTDYGKQVPTKADMLMSGADLLLVLLDCIPFFWFFRALPEIPDACTEVRKRWREEASIRSCFYTWLVCLTVLAATLLLYFK